MSTAEQILQFLFKAKATAQAPVALASITKEIGSLAESVLDSMYEAHPKIVNRAQITRSGVTHLVYWPTGALKSSEALRIQLLRAYPKQLPPPRRNEIKPQAEPANKEDSIMATKVRAPEIVKHIQQNALTDINTLSADIAKSTGGDAKKIYDMVNYLKKINVVSVDAQKHIVIKKHAAAEAWLAQNNLLDTTKSGSGQSDAEGIAIPVEPTVEPLQDGNESLLSQIDAELREGEWEAIEETIPAFLRKENQPKPDHQAITETVAAAIADFNASDFTPAKTFVLEEKPESKVRFAFTSDRTLLIFNLQEKPIELDKAATADLDSFLGDLCLIERDGLSL